MEPFEDRDLERVIEQVSDQVPFEIAEHDVVLRGLCESCAN
jgi:Fe2+ or Zn2+ uptake regulation protein